MTPSDKELRFRRSLKSARWHRKELMGLLIERITQEDKVLLKDLPVNYGLLGDLEHDCSLLSQLLNIENK